MSTAYQFDYVLSEIENLTGYSPNTIMSKLGKFNIYFNTSVLSDEGEESTEPNAYYVLFQQFFLTLKTSKVETIPFSTNLKIIAHEFGHFFYLSI